MQDTDTPTPDAPAAPPAGNRRRVWLPRVLALVVLAAAAIVLIRVATGAGEPSAADRTATISAELKQRMTTALEQLPAEGHQGHGGSAAAGPVRLICGARVYGYEPAGAASVAEVDKVYGFHMCATAETGTPWYWAPKLVAPLVMLPKQQPPVFEMAQSSATATYQESLHRLIPVRYQELATQGALEPDTMADLQRRFAAATGTTASPGSPG